MRGLATHLLATNDPFSIRNGHFPCGLGDGNDADRDHKEENDVTDEFQRLGSCSTGFVHE